MQQSTGYLDMYIVQAQIIYNSTGYLDMYKHEIFTSFPFAAKHRIIKYVQEQNIYNISLCSKAQDI